MAGAVTVLAKGEVLTACSEDGASGSEGRVGGERRKEFLRMPKKSGQAAMSSVRRKGQEAPFGRLGGEDMCMVGETWVIFCVREMETADKKSPFLINVV